MIGKEEKWEEGRWLSPVGAAKLFIYFFPFGLMVAQCEEDEKYDGGGKGK